MSDKGTIWDFVLTELQTKQAELAELFGCQIRVERSRENFRVWRVRDATITYDHIVAGFTVTPMIHCPWVVTFGGSWVGTGYTNRGIGTILHDLRVRAARYAGVRVLLCTTNDNNALQTAILLRHGWQSVSRFANSKTSAGITLWKKELNA